MVPGAAIGITVRAGDLRERGVDAPPVLLTRGAIHGRAHERVAKLDARADRQLPAGDRRVERVLAERQRIARAPQQPGVAGRLRGRQQQQQPSRLRQRPDLGEHAPLHAVGRPSGPDQGEAAGDLLR